MRTVTPSPFLTGTLFLCICVTGCSETDDQRLHIDPISGSETVFDFVEKDGWTVYSGHEGRMIILAKGNSPILYVMDMNDGREITIHSDASAFGAVTVKDEDYDGVYDRLKYRNENVEVSDIHMDGVIESILNYDKKVMRVNYQGQLYELLGDESGKYIITGAGRVDLKYEANKFVPIGKPTPNKALNADP